MTAAARPLAAPECTFAPAAGSELVAREVRAVLAGPSAAAAFASLAAARERGEEPDPRPFHRLLGERRLLAVSWPRAYGGRGLDGRSLAAVVEELIRAGVPEVLHTLSVQIVGTFLLGAGTPEQCATVLPGIAAGRLAATVLYSEPDVGSDLSALTTRAEPAGTGWRITGRKVYSVKTAYADLGLVAARTGGGSTPYQGITLFLVPLDAAGVTVGRLESLADEDFADVRLDGVEVPADAVVGPVGGAWPLITEALALERTGVDHAAKAETWLRAAGSEVDTRGYGRLRTRTAAARALALRCVDQQDRGHVDAAGAAATKLWTSETAREVAWWRADTGNGPDAAYREAPGLTISAGTSEMMLELVAGSGLPLPEADEPLAAELRAAVRAVASSYDERDPDTACWPDLRRLGVFDLSVPADRGGLGLGQRALVIACAELGRELHDAGLLDTLTAADAPARESAAQVLATARIRRAAWLCGAAAGCLARTVERARSRTQFGRPLLANQSVAFGLARLAVRLDAVQTLVADLAGRVDDTGTVDPGLCAGVLAEAGELALAATREGVQLHGAYGLTAASPVARYYLRVPLAVAADLPPAALYGQAGSGT